MIRRQALTSFGQDHKHPKLDSNSMCKKVNSFYLISHFKFDHVNISFQLAKKSSWIG